MTNWTERDLELDFSYLDSGAYEAVVSRDGINADRDATDYNKEEMKVTPGQKLKIHLAQGGSWVAGIYPAK